MQDLVCGMDGDGSNASGDASESPEPELLVDQYAELPRILEVHLDRYEAGIQHHELRALWESLYGECNDNWFQEGRVADIGLVDDGAWDHGEAVLHIADSTRGCC